MTVADPSTTATKPATRRVVGHGEALRVQLQPIATLLSKPDTTDVAINRPGEAWVENDRGWHRVELPEMTMAALRSLARLIATFNAQTLNEVNPTLSGALPDGERVQVMIAPAVSLDQLSITIRKPSTTVKTRAEYEAENLMADIRDIGKDLSTVDQSLLDLKAKRQFWDFLELAVRARKNIVISGATGSGKTTLSKTLATFIPASERLVTIEDVREIELPCHPNQINLLYSAGGTGTTTVEAKELLQACLRMKPSRILLAEIRSKVAYEYIVNVSSGHPGSITTVHAGSCHEAFEMLGLRMLESAEGRELSREDIMGLLRSKVDIIIQIAVIDQPTPDRSALDIQVSKVRRITEIFYEPGLSSAWA